MVFLTMLDVPAGHLDDPVILINFLLALLIPGAVNVLAFFLFRRNFVRISLIVSQILFVLAYLFGLDVLFFLALAAMIVLLTYALIANSSVGAPAFSNNMKGKGLKVFHRESQKQGEPLFDREEVYHKVDQAVRYMSKQKMGAIITFERKMSLSEVMKSGTAVNAPITFELLVTIFYPGTRLHDGAVVIRNDKIASAAVFFTPTTRPLSGKYGSRHRAAIGISEVSDAVTVVVSEETGRISIAYQGELTPISPDQFYDTFLEYMSMVTEDLEPSEETSK